MSLPIAQLPLFHHDRVSADGVEPERWMTLNLEEREGGWGWRIERAEMEALLRDYFRLDLWSVVEDPPSAVDLHVVKAQGSSVLDEVACRRIERAGARTGRVYLHRLGWRLLGERRQPGCT